MLVNIWAAFTIMSFICYMLYMLRFNKCLGNNKMKISHVVIIGLTVSLIPIVHIYLSYQYYKHAVVMDDNEFKEAVDDIK